MCKHYSLFHCLPSSNHPLSLPCLWLAEEGLIEPIIALCEILCRFDFDVFYKKKRNIPFNDKEEVERMACSNVPIYKLKCLQL